MCKGVRNKYKRRQRVNDTVRQTERLPYKQTDGLPYRWTGRQAENLIYNSLWTGKQMVRLDRQNSRQTDGQSKTDRWAGG